MYLSTLDLGRVSRYLLLGLGPVDYLEKVEGPASLIRFNFIL